MTLSEAATIAHPLDRIDFRELRKSGRLKITKKTLPIGLLVGQTVQIFYRAIPDQTILAVLEKKWWGSLYLMKK